MYLSEIKLWNFRKFGSENFDYEKPHLHLFFEKGLNLLVGENDSGKTAIIDAIRILLATNNYYERNRLEIDDFYQKENKKTEKLRIECIFHFQNDDDAKNFLEYTHFLNKPESEPIIALRVFLEAYLKDDYRVLPYEIRGGIGEGNFLTPQIRELLRVTFLKPLRDAETELQAKKNSRLSQILASHKFTNEKKDENGKLINHPLVDIVIEANKSVKDFFISNDDKDSDEKKLAVTLLNDLNKSLNKFLGLNDKKLVNFDISETNIKGVLEKLMLTYLEINKGLGSQNLLFIAVELLLLERDDDFTGLRLALIEEMEAHLHPQAQMRLIEYLQNEAEKKNVQILLTTHSPNLASKVKLKNLILFKNNCAYPMGSDYTMLQKEDYSFLERFLDVTKANLFFAKGVILVEGDAENLLLPTIAKIIDCDLTKYGVSIVNLGGLTFKYYQRIFQRKNGKDIGIPISVVTDVDTKVWEYYIDTKNDKNLKKCYFLTEDIINQINEKYNNQFQNLVFNQSVFETEDKVLEYFRTNLCADRTNLPKGFKNFFKENIQTRDITKDELNNIQSTQKEKKVQQYSFVDTNIKGFVNSHWTLEYELGLSCLRTHFYTAILMAKNKYFDEGILLECQEQAKNEIEEWKTTKTNEQIAYQIYWIEMMGRGKNPNSKAIVAQFFAEILEKENQENLKKLIEEDPYMKYLVDAIKHVTQNC